MVEKVATAAMFHEDVDNSSVSISISVMVISYNVVVMKVVQDVYICYNLFSISLARTLIVELFAGENTAVAPRARTKPSVFRRTLRLILTEPSPLTSSGP